MQVMYVEEADSSETDLSDEKFSWTIESRSNTWSHQRRKRRQQRREQRAQKVNETPGETTKREKNSDSSEVVDGECETAAKRARLEVEESVEQTADVKSRCQTEASHETAPSSAVCETVSVDDLRKGSGGDDARNDNASELSASSAGEGTGGEGVLLKCEVTVCKSDTGGVALELSWIDGQNRELLHQFLQYFKNRLV